MNAFLAIIGDTWRQSKHQWVMVVMLFVLALTIPMAVLQVEVREAPDGTPIVSHFRAPEHAQRGMETGWNGLYADALRHDLGYDEELAKGRRAVSDKLDEFNLLDFEYKRLVAQGAPEAQLDAIADARRAAQEQAEFIQDQNRELSIFVNSEVNRQLRERTEGISDLQRGAEFWLASMAHFIFTISMIGFIAVCAGYIPNMIESGSIDLMLSKPIKRWHIFFGKYVGGLILFSLAIIVVFIAIFVGVGMKIGVWHWQFFGALPMTLFSLALLFAIVAFVGLWTRSTGMSMVIGYVYFVVVDTAVGILTDPAAYPFVAEMDWLKDWIEVVKLTFPSFHWLRKSAEAAVFSIVVIPWQQILVGFAWLVLMLGTGYNRFRINDY
jgi:ABC-type transport system involved in multi-copper enzyme maturation permease subunit